MAAPKVRINHATAAKILRSPAVVQMVNAAADAILGQLDEDDEGFVESYTTDRGAAAVLVPAEVQARDGALTRAAAAVGLPVTQAAGSE
ncbi:hypothetical protein [Nocardia brasiliensis]|uniref:hypothetical protein n=1 Tax=Nocardia brasiliensis TaxID=37326 RepID=UPI003671C028